MSVISRPSLRRIKVISLNASLNLINPIFSVIISILAIRLFSESWWGDFVKVLIFVNLVNHFLSWGHKEYLLKEFSRAPYRISQLWQTSFVSRFPLFIIPIAALLFINFPPSTKVLIIFWIAGHFVHKSLDTLILYHRKFSLALILEFSGYVLTLLFMVLYPEKFEIDHLILIYAGLAFFKALILFGQFRSEILPRETGVFQVSFLSLTLPFFLPVVTGFIASKADLYIVSFLLDSAEIGKYQIFMNFLVFIHSMAVFAITPFLKVIYRLNAQSIRKLENLLISVSFFYSAGLLLIVYTILNIYLDFRFSMSMYVIAYLLLLPYFFYFIKMHQFFRYNKQMIVVGITFVTAILNLALSLLLIPKIGLEGALISGTVAQWAHLAGFLYAERFWNSKESSVAQVKKPY